jgi:hypothetical protein
MKNSSSINGKIYVLMPGGVISKSDGQWHNISAGKLLMLYRADPEDCVQYDCERAFTDTEYARNNDWKLSLIQLKPDYHGEYLLPEPSISINQALSDITDRKWSTNPTKQNAVLLNNQWPFPVVFGRIPDDKDILTKKQATTKSRYRKPNSEE